MSFMRPGLADVTDQIRPPEPVSLMPTRYALARCPSSCLGSMSDVSPYQSRQGGKQDAEIQSKRLPVDVLKVQRNHCVEVHRVASPHLPETGDPRFDRQAQQVPLGVVLDLVAQRGAWAHHTHVAPEHIVELRQLVQCK